MGILAEPHEIVVQQSSREATSLRRGLVRSRVISEYDSLRLIFVKPLELNSVNV